MSSRGLLARLEALEKGMQRLEPVHCLRAPFDPPADWAMQVLGRARETLGWSVTRLEDVADQDWPAVRRVALDLIAEGDAP